MHARRTLSLYFGLEGGILIYSTKFPLFCVHVLLFLGIDGLSQRCTEFGWIAGMFMYDYLGLGMASGEVTHAAWATDVQGISGWNVSKNALEKSCST